MGLLANPLHLLQIRDLKRFERAFESCFNLVSMEIPSSVKEIGDEAFSNGGFQSISFGLNSKLERISSSSFENCSKLMLIEIPANVKEVDEETFAKSNVKSVVFAPDSKLRKIARGAFQRCALETICIPSSVEIIENTAFADCNQLTSVLIEGNSKLKRVSPSAFHGCNRVQIIEYPHSVNLRSTARKIRSSMNVGSKSTTMTINLTQARTTALCNCNLK